jgi:hypothetical protein
MLSPPECVQSTSHKAAACPSEPSKVTSIFQAPRVSLAVCSDKLNNVRKDLVNEQRLMHGKPAKKSSAEVSAKVTRLQSTWSLDSE